MFFFIEIKIGELGGVVMVGTKWQGDVKEREGNKKKDTSRMKWGKCKSVFLVNLPP